MSNLGAGPFVIPGKARHLIFNRHRHQVVISGMELDLVDAHTVAVEGLEFWNMPIGLIGFLKNFGAARYFTKCRQRLHGRATTFSLNPFFATRHHPTISPGRQCTAAYWSLRVRAD